MVTKASFALPSAFGKVSPSRTIFPDPFGVIVILLLAASWITIDPELVPLFVFKVKSPVPFVVIVASALLSPTWTVSACNVTSPVPFGTISIFALDVDTMSFPLTSKSPPSCGEVSSTTSDIPVPIASVLISGSVSYTHLRAHET